MEPSKASKRSTTADGDKKSTPSFNVFQRSKKTRTAAGLQPKPSSDQTTERANSSTQRELNPKDAYEQLEYVVTKIYLHCTAEGFSYSENYGLVSFMSANAQHKSALMSMVIAATKAYLYAVLTRVECLDFIPLMRNIFDEWKKFNRALNLICQLFIYIEINSPRVSSLKEDGVSLWRKIILEGTMRFRFVSRLLPLVNKERDGEGEIQDRMFIVDSMRMLMMDNILMLILDKILALEPMKDQFGGILADQDFEERYLEIAASYHDIESQISLIVLDSNLTKIQSHSKEESMRVAKYLRDPDTQWKACKVVNKEMIHEYLQNLLGMMGGVRCAYDLKNMRMLGSLSSWFHTNEIGRDHLLAPDRTMTFVKSLFDLKDRFDKLMRIAFPNDGRVQMFVDSAIESLINIFPTKIPQFIASYFDLELRREYYHSYGDTSSLLDSVIELFGYLKNKDLFLGYHSNYLKKRLLSERYVSLLQSERSFISKLKASCDDPRVNKLEIMLEDIKTSKDLMETFNVDLYLQSELDRLKLSLRVLSSRAWPISRVSKCNLPTEMLVELEKFSASYTENHPHRRLLCQSNMGNAEVVVHLGNENRCELALSTYQMCILWQFEETDRLMYEDILQKTGIAAPELKRNLKSLACETGRSILRREPAKSREIGEGDWFIFNENFTREKYKVENNHTSTAQNQSPAWGGQTQHRVEENRNPQIDAAILRIMKERKLMEHQRLLKAVTSHFQGLFLPTPQSIKNRVESLVHREFLERDSENLRQYRYRP